MADPRAADAGDAPAPRTRRERREAERRTLRAAAESGGGSAPAPGDGSPGPAAGAADTEPPVDAAPTARRPQPATAAPDAARAGVDGAPAESGVRSPRWGATAAALAGGPPQQPAPEPAQAGAAAPVATVLGASDQPAAPEHDGRSALATTPTAVPGVGAEEEPHAPGPVAPGEIPDISTPQPNGGRNVPVAIGVGLGLGAIVVASLFAWRKEAFLGLAIVACGVALWELSRAVHVRDIRLPLLPLLVGTVGILVSAYRAGNEALLVATVLTAGGAFVWRVLDGGGVPALRDATAAMFAGTYVPFLAGFVALMLRADDGPWRVLTFIAVCVASDTGGYIAGVLLGRTRMAPIVSPKKSWEGLGGSYLAASAVGVSMVVLTLDGPWWAGLLLGVAGVTAATLGDLAESLLKRDLGVKDMGALLPGHGGVLDRVDSLLFAAPVAFGVLAAVLGSGA